MNLPFSAEKSSNAIFLLVIFWIVYFL
jgi:hypothetical protein